MNYREWERACREAQKRDGFDEKVLDRMLSIHLDRPAKGMMDFLQGLRSPSGWMGSRADPPLIKASDPILQLRGRPIDADCRILSEENYQLAVAALKLAATIAATCTDDETEDGLSGDDAARTISEWIEDARGISQARPSASRPSSGFENSFRVEPLIDPCPACSGDGELTEYPPDDDERMVACIHCGGTGERT